MLQSIYISTYLFNIYPSYISLYLYLYIYIIRFYERIFRYAPPPLAQHIFIYLSTYVLISIFFSPFLYLSIYLSIYNLERRGGWLTADWGGEVVVRGGVMVGRWLWGWVIYLIIAKVSYTYRQTDIQTLLRSGS